MEVYIGMNSGNYKFVKPGAMHQARWMAKQLYCYELVMLKDFLPSGIVSKYQTQKLQRFVDFCTFVLNPWWFNCPLAASASRHDLALMDAIKKYDTVDGTVGAAALKAFGRHIWNFAGELIPLALWDDEVPAVEKKCLASNLLKLDLDPHSKMQFVTRQDAGFGKPQLPGVVAIKEHLLCDFINANSRICLRFCKFLHFLGKLVKEREEDDGYSFGRDVIGTLRVCKDSAERE